MKLFTIVLILALLLSGCGTSRSAPAPVETTSRGTVVNQSVSVDDFPMKSTPKSTCFSAIGYKDGNLIVTFRDSGASYIYYYVPRPVYDELRLADSMGGYYNSEIKGQYDCEKLAG